MRRQPDAVQVEWGPNVLEFSDVDTAAAFAHEQGCDLLKCWPIWYTTITT